MLNFSITKFLDIIGNSEFISVVTKVNLQKEHNKVRLVGKHNIAFAYELSFIQVY